MAAVPISVRSGLTDAQLEMRRKLITASDVAAIVGIDPFKTKYDVYAEKILGRSATPPGWRAERGLVLEPALLSWVARAKGWHIRHNRETHIDSIFPWLGATTDAFFAENENGKPFAVGDVKCPGVRVLGHWFDVDEDGLSQLAVPEHVHVQVAVQMHVERMERGLVIADLPGENEPAIFELDRDEDLIAVILEECDRFRVDHLDPQVPPLPNPAAPDGSDSAVEMVKRLFPKQRTGFVEWNGTFEDLAHVYFEAHRDEKDAKARKQAAQANICALLGEHEGVRAKSWRATWKLREATTVQTYTRDAYRHFDIREIGKKKGTDE